MGAVDGSEPRVGPHFQQSPDAARVSTDGKQPGMPLAVKCLRTLLRLQHVLLVGLCNLIQLYGSLKKSWLQRCSLSMSSISQARQEYNSILCLHICGSQSLMREQMRNMDRAMSNIESHPEGFNALRRMYENVQVSPASGSTHASCFKQ